VEAPDGALYALTYADSPELVRVDIEEPERTSAVLTTLRVFDRGLYRNRWLAQRDYLLAGPDGVLFGSIGVDGGCALYRFAPASGEYRELSFTDASYGPPLMAASGELYGLLRTGTSTERRSHCASVTSSRLCGQLESYELTHLPTLPYCKIHC
jgi:hypothetical protein